jgi:aspartyl-tRNA synthetase
MERHDLESLSGVGPASAQALTAAGFTDRSSIASATVEQLVAVKGFAEARASALIAEAKISQMHHVSLDLEGSEETERKKPVAAEDRSEPKKRKKLRQRHADLKKRAKKARKKAKKASSKKKRKVWAAEADRLGKKAKKIEKRL